jgi:phage-related baseplate assembly protein
MRFEDLKFAEDDARILADKLKGIYEAIRRTHGEPGFRQSLADPERLIQLTEATILAQVSQNIDYAGKGSLLFFADENTVEHIGYLYGERGKRLDASHALTTIRYTLSVKRSIKTVIPSGSRVTADNKIFFATMATLEIPAGELTGEIEAKCLTTGIDGDGFGIGTIKNMVDLMPFVSAIENITPSTGGEGVEGLDAYKERLRILPESFSVAGPDGAYEFWARTANPEIVDSRVWMSELDMQSFAEFLEPWGITDANGFYNAIFNYFRTSGTGPGNVDVTVLMKDGELPSNEVLQQVNKTLSARTRRPLTDFVHVKKPAPIEFNVHLRFWIDTERATEASSIIEAVNNAVDRYIAWQKSALGLDILPDMLRKLVLDCGVKRLEIIEPEFMVLQPYEVAQFGSDKTVTYDGLEDA